MIKSTNLTKYIDQDKLKHYIMNFVSYKILEKEQFQFDILSTIKCLYISPKAASETIFDFDFLYIGKKDNCYYLIPQDRFLGHIPIKLREDTIFKLYIDKKENKIISGTKIDRTIYELNFMNNTYQYHAVPYTKEFYFQFTNKNINNFLK